MQVFNPLVFLVVGLAFGQMTPDPESTTILPTSTAESPSNVSVSTRSPKSSSTTPLPTSSTPEVPTSSEAPQTTNIPTTSKPPGPEEGSWNVTDGNVTCIQADLAIEFKVPNVNDSIFLSPMATSERSNCYLTNTTQSLVLEYDNYVLAFEFEKDSTHTFVRNITFSYTSIETDMFYNDTKLFLVKNGNSYLCKSIEEIPLGNATMHVFKIQIQAFGSSNETAFRKAEECELDDSVSDVVPIAVACALAGLIVIVLIAYLIGRRRVRQTGYTSV